MTEQQLMVLIVNKVSLGLRVEVELDPPQIRIKGVANFALPTRGALHSALLAEHMMSAG